MSSQTPAVNPARQLPAVACEKNDDGDVLNARVEALEEIVRDFNERRSHATSAELGTLSEAAQLLQGLPIKGGCVVLPELAILQKFETLPLSSVMPAVIVGLIMGTTYLLFLLPLDRVVWSSYLFLGFNAAYFLAVWSYLQGVAVDPGRIPDDWEGEPTGLPRFVKHNRTSEFTPIERKKNGNFRYCNKESKFKPDRAHYCSAMSRNVLRMDHYCPWLMNCVGFYNHKHFFLFLLYTVICTNVVCLKLGMHLWQGCCASAGYTFVLYQGLILSVVISGMLSPFFGFHCWLLSKNITTIEFCEKYDEGCFTSLYDMGLLQNVQSIMGESWYLWPFPVGAPMGNGMTWNVPRKASRKASVNSGRGKVQRTSRAMVESVVD